MKLRHIAFLVLLQLLCCCGKTETGYVINPPKKTDSGSQSGSQSGSETQPGGGEEGGGGSSEETPPAEPPADGFIVVGYAYADSGELPDPNLVTHINFSFAKIQDDFETLYIRDKKITRLKKIVALKQENPNLKVLLSVGGWGAGNFSEMAADETHRKNFAQNCLKAVNSYKLDGIDIDWEYPGSSDAGISSSSNDKQNFTLLLKDLRAALGNDKLLTMASEAGAGYVDWATALPYLNFVNIMSYDMGRPPTHNAALYKGSRSKMSCDEAVAKHFAKGIPYNKMTLGMAFFGRVDRNILQGDELDYNEIIQLTGFNKCWDDQCKVPYLTDAVGTMVLSYDDETSIGLKAEYVKSKGLLGGMYWDIEADDANHTLGKSVATRLIGYVDETPEDIPTYLVTNEYMQNYMENVHYTDRVYTSAVTQYPGGGPGEADIPPSVTVKWTAASGSQKLTLMEEGGWTRTYSVSSGVGQQELTNLVPNVIYNWNVTSSSGSIVAEGKFRTTGSIHQLFLKPKVRNARDLGGWTTTDGKTLRYRLLYRGGKVSSSNMKTEGKEEGLAQGILAELDLRELDDVPSKSYFGDKIAFLAPGFSVYYRAMLRDRAEGIKESFQFIVKNLRENKPVYFHCAAGRDRTGVMAMVIEGVLGVPESQIGKDYELTYFAPADWSMQDDGLYHHMRTADGSYQPAIEYLWKMSKDGTLKSGVEQYLLGIGVPQQDIDDLRSIMLK